MKVLVTGAQGFIGRYLCAHLLACGHEVVGLGRSPETERFTHHVGWVGQQVAAPLPRAMRDLFRSSAYRYRALDMTDAEALADCLDGAGFEVIYHLAGALRDSPIDQLVRSNIVASQLLFDAAAGVPVPPRIVFGSSGSVTGALPEALLPVRADRAQALQPVDPYAVTKRAAEDLAVVAQRQHDLQIVTGRIFAVMGPGQEERHLCGHLARQFAERRAGLSEAEIAVGPLTVTRDFVDVRDVAAQLVLLGETAAPPELCNIASGRETPTAEVFRTLKALTGDASELAPSSPGRRLELGRSVADISAVAGLGFASAYDLRRSLSDLLDWYLEEVAEAAG